MRSVRWSPRLLCCDNMELGHEGALGLVFWEPSEPVMPWSVPPAGEAMSGGKRAGADEQQAISVFFGSMVTLFSP